MASNLTPGHQGGLRARWRRTRRPGALGDSLAPLIDVLFLLLFFLLVTSRYDRQRVLDVELPHAHSAEPAPEVRPGQLRTLTVHADGSLVLNGVPVDLTDLGTILLALPREERLLPIFVQADAATALGRGVEVLDRLRVLGFHNHFLEVRSPPPGSDLKPLQRTP